MFDNSDSIFSDSWFLHLILYKDISSIRTKSNGGKIRYSIDGLFDDM